MDEEDYGSSLRMPQLTRRYKLEPLPHILKIVQGCAKIRCTRREAAAVLGVSYDTFLAFMTKYPEAQQAWDSGVLIGKASLRRLLWRQAQGDPAQARFLAKDTRWLSMDEGKDRIPDKTGDTTVNILNLAPDQRLARIEELQQKVIPHAAPKPGRIGSAKPERTG